MIYSWLILAVWFAIGTWLEVPYTLEDVTAAVGMVLCFAIAEYLVRLRRDWWQWRNR